MFYEMQDASYNLTKVVRYKRLVGTKKAHCWYSEPVPEKSYLFGLIKVKAKEGFWYRDYYDHKEKITEEQAHHNDRTVRLWFQGEDYPRNWDVGSVEEMENLIKKIEECSVNCKFSASIP